MQDNKQIISQFFARFSASDIEGALALMTDDVTWHIPGKPALLPTAGLYDRKRLRALFQHMLGRLNGGLKMTMLNAIGEGDQLAVEAESCGDLHNGRAYRQQYHFYFAFRAAKIAAVREYLDTQHAYEVWFKP